MAELTDREKSIALTSYREGAKDGRHQAGELVGEYGRRIVMNDITSELEAIDSEIKQMKKESWTPPEEDHGSRQQLPTGDVSSLSKGQKEAARRMGLDLKTYARGAEIAKRKGLI